MDPPSSSAFRKPEIHCVPPRTPCIAPTSFAPHRTALCIRITWERPRVLKAKIKGHLNNDGARGVACPHHTLLPLRCKTISSSTPTLPPEHKRVFLHTPLLPREEEQLLQSPSSSSWERNMTRLKNTPRRYLLLLACIALPGVALISDFLWASSSSSSSSSFFRSRRYQRPRLKSGVESWDRLRREELNATFADLPAPEIEWEELPDAPVPRLDGAAVQIRDLLYVFNGYGTLDYVHSRVDVLNMTSNAWTDHFDAPKEMAHSHLGMATDGRYVYIVTGQYGPQCRGPISRCFVLDTKTRTWEGLPSLPLPRYAPATQLWRGRLHVMGGSKEDRHEPGLEHWSLAVKDGKALESEWRTEIPIPRGGPHRACVVVDNKLYVIGGQEGDFMAKPGSPIFKCSRRHEVVYGDVYMLDESMKWKELPPMPKPNSHIEFAWVVVNNSIVIVGGTTEKHPISKRMMLVGEVFQFNLETLEWTVTGRMPFRMKTTLTGLWDGYLYFTSGQRDRGPDNPSPRKVVGSTFRTKLRL